MSIAIRASAPGRAGILGNPSDGYGGCVISGTVPFRAEAVFTPSGSAFSVRFDGATADLRGPESRRLAGDRFDLVRSVLNYLGPDRAPHGVLSVESTIPRQAGLAGSTALLAAIACALGGAESLLGTAELAERLRLIERRYLNVACGFQDQYSIVFGGLNFLDFAGKERQRESPPDPYAQVEPLPAPPDDALPFVVAHTGRARDSGAVHEPLRARWEAGDGEVIAAYERIASICREGRAHFVEADWCRFGALMDENHAIQRSLGGSGPANEALIAAAKAAGAYGAKLAGAGQGGTIVALHPDPEALARVLRRAGATHVFRLQRTPGLRVSPLDHAQ